MRISIYSREVKNGKAKFKVYYCKTKDGKYYDVRFTKNSNGALDHSAVIEVDKANVFTTKENGFDKLVINGPYEEKEAIEFQAQELPDFE